MYSRSINQLKNSKSAIIPSSCLHDIVNQGSVSVEYHHAKLVVEAFHKDIDQSVKSVSFPSSQVPGLNN